MRDEPDPPRKFYQLKPRDFDAVNAPASAAPRDSTPTDVKGHLRAANALRIKPRKPAATTPPANDVQALLRESADYSNVAGVNDLAPLPRRRSRRKRDFWLVLIPVDVFLAIVVLGPYSSPSMRIYALSGIVMFTLGLSWVMWMVMDDY